MVLMVAPEDLLQQSVVVEEFEMAAVPKLLQQEVLPQKPKCFEPKPGPGTEFQAALVKTAQTATAVVEFGLKMLKAEEELQEGWVQTARLDIAGAVSRTRSVGLGKLSWADLLTLYVQRGKMEVEDVMED